MATIAPLEIIATAMAATNGQGESWFRPSLEVASRVFDLSSIALALGACVVFVATALIVWLGIVKEHHWDELREHANEKIAILESETAKSNAEVARAHEGLAKANAEIAVAHQRTAEFEAKTREADLRLAELRKRIAPRHVDGDKLVSLLRDKRKAPVEIMFVKDDGEAFNLAIEIRAFLHIANWPVEEPVPIPPTDLPGLSKLPSAMGAGGQPSGVSLVVNATTPEDFAGVENPKPEAPYGAMRHALLESLGQLSTTAGGRAVPAKGVMRIVVGPKPQL